MAQRQTISICCARGDDAGDIKMKKLVIGTALLLATLAATPSFAATYHSRQAVQ
jgi:hypothetical protein